MATEVSPIDTLSKIPPRVHSSSAFVQALMSAKAMMKFQRAAQLITSSLDLEMLLDRVVNDIADAIGCVEVSVWLRDPNGDEMVLHGVRGCTTYRKGARLKIGERGMVGHVAATGATRYARDVTVDPYYISCEVNTRSELSIPLMTRGEVIGVLCVDHKQTNAFAEDEVLVLEALAGHIAVAIENARLFRNERLEREQLKHEAEEARAVQQSLFVKAVPLVCGFAFVIFQRDHIVSP